jgi:hypothetical protein
LISDADGSRHYETQHLPATGGRMDFEGPTGNFRRAFFIRGIRGSRIESGSS